MSLLPQPDSFGDDTDYRRDTTLFPIPVIERASQLYAAVSMKRNQLDAVSSAFNSRAQRPVPLDKILGQPTDDRIAFFQRAFPAQLEPDSTFDTILTCKLASVMFSASEPSSPLSMLFEGVIADSYADYPYTPGRTPDSPCWERSSEPRIRTSDRDRAMDERMYLHSPCQEDGSSVKISADQHGNDHHNSSQLSDASSAGSSTVDETPGPAHQAFSNTSSSNDSCSASTIVTYSSPPQIEKSSLLHSHCSSPTSTFADGSSLPPVLPVTPRSAITDVATMLDETLAQVIADRAKRTPIEQCVEPSVSSATRAERQTRESGVDDLDRFRMPGGCGSLCDSRASFGTFGQTSAAAPQEIVRHSPIALAMTKRVMKQKTERPPARPPRPEHCRGTLEDLSAITVPVFFVQRRSSPTLRSIRKSPEEYLNRKPGRMGSVADRCVVAQNVKKESGGVAKFQLGPAPPKLPRKDSARATRGVAWTDSVAAGQTTVGVTLAGSARSELTAPARARRISSVFVQTFVSARSRAECPIETAEAGQLFGNDRTREIKVCWVHESAQQRDDPIEVLNVEHHTTGVTDRRSCAHASHCSKPLNQSAEPRPPSAVVWKKPSLLRKLSTSLRRSPSKSTDPHAGGTDYSRIAGAHRGAVGEDEWKSAAVHTQVPNSAPLTHRPTTIRVVASTASLATVKYWTATCKDHGFHMRSADSSIASAPTRTVTASSTPPSTTITRLHTPTVQATSLARSSSHQRSSSSPSPTMLTLKRKTSFSSTHTSSPVRNTRASSSVGLIRKPSRTTIVGSAKQSVTHLDGVAANKSTCGVTSVSIRRVAT